MRILYDNLWDDYDIYDYSTQDDSYPVANTQHIHLTTVWHTSSLNDQYVTIDFGTSTALTCVAISGHNLSSAAVVKFQMHGSDSWGAPDLNETLTWRDGHIIGFFTSTSKRFCRVYIDDPTNTDGYVSIGRIFVGTYLAVSPSSLIDFVITNQRNDLITETDMSYIYATPGVSRRVFSYSFPKSKQSMIASLRTVYDTVGKYKPIYVLNYNTSWTDIEPCYGRLLNDFEENRKSGNFSEYVLQIKECS